MPYFQRVSVFSSFPARVEIFIEMNTDTSIQLRVRVKLSAGEEAAAENYANPLRRALPRFRADTLV